jgi:hypothetical protein
VLGIALLSALPVLLSVGRAVLLRRRGEAASTG